MTGKINKERQIYSYEFKKNILYEIFSKEMADYLSTTIGDLGDCEKKFWNNVIGLSLLDIFKKYDYAKALSLKELEDECKLVIDNLECKNKEVFYLKQVVRNSDMLEYLFDERKEHRYSIYELHKCIDILDSEYGICDHAEEDGEKPFFNYEDALNYIHKKCQESDHDYNLQEPFYEWCYYKLEKWVDDGKCHADWPYADFESKVRLSYVYYIVNGKIVLVSNGRKVSTRGSFEYISCPNDLNLPIPFKAGDLVSCKMKPFVNDKNMLILEVGDNRDCCSVQILCNDEYGHMKVGALKHIDIVRNEPFPCISPLYSLRKIGENDLKNDEKYFLQWKREINGDEKKGREVWHQLTKSL
jgi:hypothetical protein